MINLREGHSESGASSHDTAQSLSIFGGKGFTRPNLDWREFFNGEELDKAYQIVEVEQRDETSDHDDMSMGSNSDPSEDNLDQQMMYQEVYGLTDAQNHIESRKKRFDLFVQKLDNDPF